MMSRRTWLLPLIILTTLWLPLHDAVANPAQTAWPHGAMVSVANPLAAQAAIKVLEQGGNAVDASIAAHAVLGLVEPQSSGLGGGAFALLHRPDAPLTFYDGREMSPQGAQVDMFMQNGVVMPKDQAQESGRAIGVPGMVALYERLHQDHGHLPWARLFDSAIALAEQGFIVSPRLAYFVELVGRDTLLYARPESAAYFFPEGNPLQAGQRRDNPAYAQTLRRIATHGANAFYQDDIAASIAAAAQSAPLPGTLTEADMAAYEVIKRPVICGEFRQYNICTTSPPSSGGAQIMIPVMYDHLVPEDATMADKLAAFVDAQRLAYADRDHYFGDPDEVKIPLESLLNPDYLKYRATQRFAPATTPTPGNPAAVLDKAAIPVWGSDTTNEMAGTTHLSIIDAQGQAVAMTATIEGYFGSRRWTHGFLLNNEMTDFARDVPPNGKPMANAVSPRRRPRSSMSPTMIFDDSGELVMVTGSPGGNAIPAYVSKTILGILAWGMSPQAATDFPNIVARGKRVKVEVKKAEGQMIADDLQSRGYDVWERDGENSGIHLITVTPDGLSGAADPRREGVVLRLDTTMRPTAPAALALPAH